MAVMIWGRTMPRQLSRRGRLGGIDPSRDQNLTQETPGGNNPTGAGLGYHFLVLPGTVYPNETLTRFVVAEHLLLGDLCNLQLSIWLRHEERRIHVTK